MIKVGDILYHGTSANDLFEDEYETPEGPAWFSESRSVAEKFINWNTGKRPRLLTYRVTAAPDLLVWTTHEDLVQWFEQQGADVTSILTQEMAQIVGDAGEDGWIIPNNYPDGADILLVEPGFWLKLVTEDEDEEAETPTEVFQAFLDGWEDLNKSKFSALMRELDLPRREVEFDNGSVLVLDFKGAKYVIEIAEDGAFEAMKVTDWLGNAIMQADEFVTIDTGLDEFWVGAGPRPKLYHGTDEDNIEDMLAGGIEAREETRGIANRGTGMAVFTSLEPDEASSYGAALFEIDTDAMYREGFHPRLDIEAGIADYEAMTALRARLGLDDDDYIIDEPDSSESYDTVVVFADIPARYLRLVA